MIGTKRGVDVSGAVVNAGSFRNQSSNWTFKIQYFWTPTLVEVAGSWNGGMEYPDISSLLGNLEWIGSIVAEDRTTDVLFPWRA
jgi:hypothetical protein